MYTNIEIFKSEEFGKVRTVLINGNPWFIGKDIAVALGYNNTRKALADHVEDEDKRKGDGVTIRDSIGREQIPTVINESGLYSLIFSSKLESAKRFKRWVTSEVLPAIRKTGAYSASDGDPQTEEQETISARELAAMLKRKQCKVCYRIDRLLDQHPEYQSEFIPGTFRNIQGREFRTYDLTEKGLGIFIRLLEADGNRNSENTVKGLRRIRSLYPVSAEGFLVGNTTEVSLCPRTGLAELQKAEAALDMFEQCYLGVDFAEFDQEERERFDSALCLLHDHVKAAVAELKGA